MFTYFLSGVYILYPLTLLCLFLSESSFDSQVLYYIHLRQMDLQIAKAFIIPQYYLLIGIFSLYYF